jgi:hypothetical protein
MPQITVVSLERENDTLSLRVLDIVQRSVSADPSKARRAFMNAMGKAYDALHSQGSMVVPGGINVEFGQEEE